MLHIELPIASIAPDSPLRIEHEGMKLVVVRRGGEIFAYEDVCPHAFWPLSQGTVQNGVLECPGHGWEFNVATGRSVNAPAYCLTPVSVIFLGETIRLQWEPKWEPKETAAAVR